MAIRKDVTLKVSNVSICVVISLCRFEFVAPRIQNFSMIVSFMIPAINAFALFAMVY